MERIWYGCRMTKSGRTQSLLLDAARLRRVQQRTGNDPDLAEVRAGLENAIGETVSRRAAARFLGVSHTTLNRWAGRGDLVLVPAMDGSLQVSVNSLLDLHDRIEESRQNGPESRHMEALMKEDQAKADRMRPYRYASKEQGQESGHRRAEKLGLAYHRAVAGRLTRTKVEEAKYRIYRWVRDGRLDSRYGDMWMEVLSQPIAGIKKAITEESPRGNDLRQNSPFAGTLTTGERQRLLKATK